MAEEERGPLSDWLELMLAEITRRQEEAQAGDIEQAARTSSQSSSSSRPNAQTPAARPKPASSHARTTHRARSV